MLHSQDVPAYAPHLAGTWEAAVWGDGFVSLEHGMRLRRAADGGWELVEAGLLLARARTDALHPNTIAPGEWELRRSYGPEPDDDWVRDPQFRVCLPPSPANSDVAPLSLADLGPDYFVRSAVAPAVRVTPRPLWYVDPPTDAVFHSGAKSSGMRYCHLCDRSTTSKNFVNQHLRNCHGIVTKSQE